MRIMVFDVPAESGGALSVLHEFYEEYKTDNSNEYIFIVSKPEIQEASNIKVLRFPWIKKSWIHRLYFDHFIAPKLITKYKIDRVLSLQNIMIPHTKIHQTVFVHNALPFSKHRFKFNEDKLLWTYQNIIGRNIIKSVVKADYVIVQTNWMKNKCTDQLGVPSNKIEVKSPKINVQVKETYKKTNKEIVIFFYPASGVVFKNHKVIIDACLKLKKDGINNYRVVFTLKGDENKHVIELYNAVKDNNLPIEFWGSMTRDEVFALYSKSILIFPSFIETVGLPLIEAKLHKSPIISADCEYSNEILSGYNCDFFNPFNPESLFKIIKNYIVR